MEISIKPYNSVYREGVVNVLQHLWHLPEQERYARFDWLYESNTNPSFREVLGVVAVDELVGEVFFFYLLDGSDGAGV